MRSEPAAAVEAWRRPVGARPWVLGHRGVRGGAAVENTLEAFQIAVDQGADGVELDVRLSADGQVVVTHDATLTRVTGGASSANVEELPLADILRVDLGRGQCVPTLAHALEWARAGDHRLNVELKCDRPNPDPLVDAVARVLSEQPHSLYILLSSFHTAAVEALSKRLERYAVAWLVDNEVDLDAARRGVTPLALGIHPQHHLVDETSVLDLRKRFALLNTWTVNREEDIERVARAGVDSLISDDPGAALAVLRNVEFSSKLH